ncbi:MAG: ABC transporter substrate-binding protein [bacterium]
MQKRIGDGRVQGLLLALRRVGLGLLLLLLAAGVLLFSDLAGRQPLHGAGFRIDFVAFSQTSFNEDALQGFQAELVDSGWVSGRDFDLSIYNANGDLATLNSILDAVQQEHPDILMTVSTPALQNALKKIEGIPIIFSNSGDPIGAGAGESFQQHLPNVTGICTLSDFTGMMDLLQDLFPDLQRIGTLYSPGEINSVRYQEELTKTARQRGVEVDLAPVSASSEIADAALSLVSRRPQAIAQIVDNLTSPGFPSLVQAAQNGETPIFGFEVTMAQQGAVAAVSRDYSQAGRDGARLALRILKGESPAEIPIQMVSRTLLALNPEAAQFFGIHFSPELLEKADLVISQESTP